MYSLITFFCVAALLIGSSGCANETARPRLGSLPYPGPFSLYVEADPDNLGEHNTRAALVTFNERERGLVYTRRAGFLDIGHVRKTIDWTRCFAIALHRPMLDGQTEIKLKGQEPTLYLLTVDYPADYETWDSDRRAKAANRWASEAGEVMSWTAMTWHEVASYFGYKATLLLPEDQSAFTYDDGVSHLVGIEVARAALGEAGLDDARAFEQAATRELNRQMQRLEAVRPKEMRKAIQAVKGEWWSATGPALRHLDMGWSTQRVRPWIVPGYESQQGPIVFETPGFAYESSEGVTLTMRLDPKILEAGSIRAAIRTDRQLLDPQTDLAAAAAYIARDVGQPLMVMADRGDETR